MRGRVGSGLAFAAFLSACPAFGAGFATQVIVRAGDALAGGGTVGHVDPLNTPGFTLLAQRVSNGHVLFYGRDPNGVASILYDVPPTGQATTISSPVASSGMQWDDAGNLYLVDQGSLWQAPAGGAFTKFLDAANHCSNFPGLFTDVPGISLARTGKWGTHICFSVGVGDVTGALSFVPAKGLTHPTLGTVDPAFDFDLGVMGDGTPVYVTTFGCPTCSFERGLVVGSNIVRTYPAQVGALYENGGVPRGVNEAGTIVLDEPLYTDATHTTEAVPEAIVTTDASGAVHLVAKAGDAIPAGPTLASSATTGPIFSPNPTNIPIQLDETGGVVFVARTSTGGETLVSYTTGGGLEAIATTGSPVEAGSTEILTGFVSVATSPNGRIAFVGTVQDAANASHLVLYVHGELGAPVEALRNLETFTPSGGGKFNVAYNLYLSYRTQSQKQRLYGFGDDGKLIVGSVKLSQGDEGLLLVDVDTPASEPPPQLVVNSTGDGPLSGSGPTCTTGGTASNGEPECTLRAAIQTVNASGKPGAITFDLPAGPILVGPALPAIQFKTDLIGPDGSLVEVKPQTAAGSGDGITFDAGVKGSLANIAVRGFGGRGVVAASGQGSSSVDGITLSGCEVTDNGGYGIANTNGTVVLEDVPARRSKVDNNKGGGIFSSGVNSFSNVQYSVHATRTDITNNGTVGVVADGEVWLGAAKIHANHGPGVAVLQPSAGGGPKSGFAISVAEFGTEITEVSNNLGWGLQSEAGRIFLEGLAEIHGQHGFGIATGGFVTIGNLAAPRPAHTLITDNGVAPDCIVIGPTIDAIAPVSTTCPGGGILTTGNSQGSESRLAAVDVSDNHGPGILAEGNLRMGFFNVERNAGSGIAHAQPSGASAAEIDLDWPGKIDQNQGAGILAGSGRLSVSANASVDVRGNLGAGIQSDGSKVVLAAPAVPGTRSTIAQNGAGGTCTDWTLDNDDKPVSAPCHSGGIFTNQSDITGASFDVTDNVGDGITANSLKASDIKVCGNTGHQLVLASKPSLTGGQICPDAASHGGGASDGGNGGCSTAPGRSSSGAALGLALLLALSRRRRRTGTGA